MFTLGTGIGCGIVVDDLVLRGEHSHGARVRAHHYRLPRRRTGSAPAASPATWRPFAAPRRSSDACTRRLPADAKARLTAKLQAGEPLTPLLLAQEAEAGDELSLELVLETARYLAVGVVNLMHTIDPNGVVLGGAMTFGGHETELGSSISWTRCATKCSDEHFPSWPNEP